MMRNRVYYGLLTGAVLATACLYAAEPAAPEPAAVEVVALEKTTRTAIPGVSISIRAIGLYRTAVTGEDGVTKFDGIVPGAGVTLSANRNDFAPETFGPVALRGGETSRIEILLALGTVRESVVVIAEAPLPLGAPEISQTFSAKRLQELPSNGRSLARFALLDPHVRNTQGLGSDGAASARLSINGSSFRHTGHMLDGSANYDVIFANAPQQSVSVSAVEELKVLTNQYSAEYGGSASGIVSAVTRSGGDQFHGEAFAFLRPSGLQANAPLSSLHTPNQRWQYGAAVGGPLGARTNYFVNYEGTQQDRGSFIQSPAPAMFLGRLDEWMALARIDHRLSDRHSVTLRLNGNHSANNNMNDRIGGFTQASTEQLGYTQTSAAQFTDRLTTSSTFNEFRASYTAYTPSATRTVNPAVSVVRPSYSTEGGSTNSWVHARATQLSDTFGAQIGSHSLRFGGDVQRQTAADFSFTPFGEYRFAAGAPSAGQNPIQYTQTFGAGFLRYGQTYASAFIQDNWKISNRLAASLGARYESQSITNDRNNIAPRAGITWDPRGDGKTVFRAGAGFFYDQYYFYITRRFFLQGLGSPTVSLTLPFGAPGFPQFPNSLATPPAAATSARRDLYLPADHLLSPYNLQYSAGVRQELAGGWAVSVDALYSHTLKQMRLRDANAPSGFVRTAPGQRRTVAQADATRPFQTWGGVPVRNVLFVENSGSSLYASLDAGLSKRFGHRFQLDTHYVYASSATYSMFFGEPNTGVPNEWSNTGAAERGPSDFYQRHRFVGVGLVDLGRGFTLSNTTNLGSGLPVNPLTGIDNNGDTLAFDRPVGFGRNSLRGPMQASVDLAVAKRLRVTERVAVELRTEVFNALNRNDYLRLNVNYGDAANPDPKFMQPVAGLQNVDPSRQMQFALRAIW